MARHAFDGPSYSQGAATGNQSAGDNDSKSSGDDIEFEFTATGPVGDESDPDAFLYPDPHGIRAVEPALYIASFNFEVGGLMDGAYCRAQIFHPAFTFNPYSEVRGSLDGTVAHRGQVILQPTYFGDDTDLFIFVKMFDFTGPDVPYLTEFQMTMTRLATYIDVG